MLLIDMLFSWSSNTGTRVDRGGNLHTDVLIDPRKSAFNEWTFLVACYATLHPALLVRWSVRPPDHWSVMPSHFFAVFGLTTPALMTKWPQACYWDSCLFDLDNEQIDEWMNVWMNKWMSVWTKSENKSGKAREVITGMKKSTISCDGQIDRQTDMNSYGCAVNTY